MKVFGASSSCVSLVLAACSLSCRVDTSADAAPPSACARLRSASAHVEDVTDGVALSLRVSRAQLDVISLQDYVGHLVDAWNRAEQGIVARCSPRLKGGAQTLASTAASSALPDGVRVVFKPVDSAHLASLREHVRGERARVLACACEDPSPPPASAAPSPTR